MLYLLVTAVVMGLVPHDALVKDGAPFVAAFQFFQAFAKLDRRGNPWFGIVVGTTLASALMGWSYSGSTGLKVFTYLVALSVVTVAIPYFLSACAQFAFLVSRRRRVQRWALARDMSVATTGLLFSLWVTFASGYQAVYQALLLLLVGLPLYAILKARKERLGLVPEPNDQLDDSADAVPTT